MFTVDVYMSRRHNNIRIIIGSDQGTATKQGIEGKIVRYRLGRGRDSVRVSDKDSDRRSQPNTVHNMKAKLFTSNIIQWLNDWLKQLI